ncbi:MAG: hypothetical protein IT448_05005 [Phycisphaerales bacterium]|nr:hypothetical protein [Phycisphaerales bacterium]
MFQHSFFVVMNNINLSPIGWRNYFRRLSATACCLVPVLMLTLIGCAPDKRAAQGVAPVPQSAVTSARSTEAPAAVNSATNHTSTGAQAPAGWRRLRHSVLLDFNSPADAVFINLSPATPAAATDPVIRNGQLVLEPETAQVQIKLSSLLSGRTFPGDWTLLGGHLQAQRDVTVDLIYSIDGQTILEKQQQLPADQFVPVMLDLTRLNESQLAASAQLTAGTGRALLTIRPHAPATILIDDILLLDNRENLTPPGATWAIQRKGYQLEIDQPDLFSLSLSTDVSQPPAWTIEQFSAQRIIAQQNNPPGQWVIYADGRSFENSHLKMLTPPAADDALYLRQHNTPAQITLPSEQGRLLRQTPGDLNNDGYNEALGAYQLQAHAARLDVTITPRTPTLTNPILEISDLPAGKLIATAEGHLIDTCQRLPDNDVLIIVPHEIQRPTTINIRVQ